MDMEHPSRTRSVLTPRLIVGAALALFGAVLTLDRLRIVEAEQILRFWPVILVAIGLQLFLQPRRGAPTVNGVIWMAIGGWLLLNTVVGVRVYFWELFWPVVLILVGTNLVMQTMRGERAAADPDGRLAVISVLSGIKRSSSGSFRGGDITAFMGGGQLDLRLATIAPGEEAIVDVFVVMGGYEVFVPSNWVVSTPVVPVMGGVDDRRLSPLPGAGQGVSGTATPRLVLRGFLMMGGITLKN